MTIFGMLRVRNEGRWIVQTATAMLPLCERIFVLDDGSTDGTPELCEQLSEKITVIRSPFRTPVDQGLDEARDKSYLLRRVMDCVSDIRLRGDTYSPFWALGLDADEVLDPSGIEVIRRVLPNTPHHAFALPVRFLWDSDLSLMEKPGHRRVRVDGVYRRFADVGRPSLFRLFNAAFGYQSTPFGNGANFHCSSIPQELLGHAHVSIPAPLWHTGYNYCGDRMRKYEFYNRVDPNNEGEGRYMHVCQGDIPDIPATAKLKHAGPMQFEMM